MKIGILGAGMIGGTVGRLWHRAGHEVSFGTRNPEKLSAMIAELGARATATTPEEAVRSADAVLLAVPLKAVPDLGRTIAPLVAGKLVLDAGNAYGERDGEAAAAAMGNAAGSAGWVASHLPGARVVKAFNTVYFKVLEAEAHRGGDDGVGIPLAGDDADALAAAAKLVRDAGFTPVVVGPLAVGKRFEPGTPVYNTGMHAADLAKALGAQR